MLKRSPGALLRACAFFAAFACSAGAAADPVATLRVRLNPAIAPAGTLTDAVRERLERLAGASFTLVGTTRTGALDLALSVPRDASDVALMLRSLRNDRAVLWAEAPSRLPMAKSAIARKTASTVTERKLMVRLKGGEDADITPLLPELSQLIGMPVALDRQIGAVSVLTIAQAKPMEQLEALAEALQAHPEVQYADPVRRATIQRTPNDPMFSQQWGLLDSPGIDAPSAWNLQTGSRSITVAVVDTGILPHPDLAGRILPGYDFISDAGRARDGDGRDTNPRDEGDFSSAGECGSLAEDSSWHGTFVAGLIGANANDGIGIAGVDWAARILPVRVLGRCGGTFDDILAGMLWASGVHIAGVPDNPTPAKVINMSLGGDGGCDQSIQEAIDDALAQGTVVVVAAGNASADATAFTPANCGGVITVGALTRSGDRSSYSNFGPRLDISAPGGDMPNSNLILSTSNDGLTAPGAPSYAHEAGTSFATPLVAGTVSLMLARNPLLTAGRALGILQGTSHDYAFGTACGAAGFACGIGGLDAGLALASTALGVATAPPGAVSVIEFYRGDLDHYFVTADPQETAQIDASADSPFERTSFLFYAYPDAQSAPADALPVCRFHAGGLIESHYYSADPAECRFVETHWAGVWELQSRAAFYVQVPDESGSCPVDTLPVYRFFNNRRDANHRYTVDLSVRRGMNNRLWAPEGAGAKGVVFCSPA